MEMTGKFFAWTQEVSDKLNLALGLLERLVGLTRRLVDDDAGKFTYFQCLTPDREDGYAGGEVGYAELVVEDDQPSELRDFITICPSGTFLITRFACGDEDLGQGDRWSILADVFGPAVQGRFFAQRAVPPRGKLRIEFKNITDAPERQRLFFAVKLRARVKEKA